MSNRGTNWARTRRFGSAARKAIAYVLGDHHNGETGRLDPSVATIAHEADLSTRAVQINLREMERRGAVMVLRTPGRRCCSYVLNWDWRGIDGRAMPHPQRAANPAYDCTAAPANPAPDSPKLEREDSTGKEEERAPASPPPPAPPPSVAIDSDGGEGKQASGRQQAAGSDRPEPARATRSARKTPLPDDWSPPPEVRDLAIEAGYDPAEIMEEIADWCRDRDHRSADWPAFARRWVRREGKFRRTAAPSRAAYAATRTGELLASLRAGIAAGAMA